MRIGLRMSPEGATVFGLIMEKLRILRITLVAALALAFPMGRAQTVTNLVFDALLKEFTAKVEDQKAEFDFSLTNVSASPITVRSVRASCGCTTPKLPALPWELAAGTNGTFHVTVDLLGKIGTFQKTVFLDTTDGPKTVSVKVVMPPSAQTPAVAGVDMRNRNQIMAQADRQLIFRGECASCHKPTPTTMGEQLFTSTCGICHEAEHRATSVPDLHALKQTPTAAYWDAWIRFGKVGTMMPAFAMEHGGPLTDPQIESLVAYLSKDFPNRPAKGAVAQPVVAPKPPVFPPARPAARSGVLPPQAPATSAVVLPPPASN